MRLIRPLLLAIIAVAGSYTAALIVAALTHNLFN